MMYGLFWSVSEQKTLLTDLVGLQGRNALDRPVESQMHRRIADIRSGIPRGAVHSHPIRARPVITDGHPTETRKGDGRLAERVHGPEEEDRPERREACGEGRWRSFCFCWVWRAWLLISVKTCGGRQRPPTTRETFERGRVKNCPYPSKIFL